MKGQETADSGKWNRQEDNPGNVAVGEEEEMEDVWSLAVSAAFQKSWR